MSSQHCQPRSTDGRRGLLVVVSGPSGVGKGAIVNATMTRLPGLRRSVSATTRAPRAGEVEGDSYYFTSREQFDRMIARDELIEWTEYLGERYGTPRHEVDRQLDAGETLVFEIDVNGGRSIRRLYPHAALAFVVPPSWEALAARLRGRNSETPQELAHRLEVARGEVEAVPEYDYVIVNDRLDDAVELLCDIIRAERARPWRVDLGPLHRPE